MKNLLLFLKGIIIGIGKIIPGVSGAVLAVILNIYDDGVDSIVNFFKNPKKNFIFLSIIGSGILVGIIIFSNVINYFLNRYYVVTILFFVGLIVGGIDNIYKEIDKKDYKYTLIVIIVFTIISILNINNNYIFTNTYKDYIIFLFGGVIETIGTVIPGLSSTALLLIIGIYDDIIIAISNLSFFTINYRILIPFLLGIVFSMYIFTKLISYFLHNYKKKTYSIILGLVISSIIIILINLFNVYIKFISLFIGIIFMFIGIFISYYFK